MTSIAAPMCLSCRHFDSEADTLSCGAFPGGIPDPILYGEFDHRKPHSRDGGMQFEQDPEKDEPLQFSDETFR